MPNLFVVRWRRYGCRAITGGDNELAYALGSHGSLQPAWPVRRYRVRSFAPGGYHRGEGAPKHLNGRRDDRPQLDRALAFETEDFVALLAGAAATWPLAARAAA